MEESVNNETIIGGEENKEFKPQFFDSTGSTANRRKIKILQQVGDEMIVEITNETNPSERGTPLTAQMMNEFDKRIFNAEKNSSSAKVTAESAERKADEAYKHSADEKGTMIYVGGKLQQTFNMDDKADKAIVEKAIEELKQKSKSISESFILTEVKVEESNGVKTFVF